MTRVQWCCCVLHISHSAYNLKTPFLVLCLDFKNKTGIPSKSTVFFFEGSRCCNTVCTTEKKSHISEYIIEYLKTKQIIKKNRLANRNKINICCLGILTVICSIFLSGVFERKEQQQREKAEPQLFSLGRQIHIQSWN